MTLDEALARHECDVSLEIGCHVLSCLRAAARKDREFSQLDDREEQIQ